MLVDAHVVLLPLGHPTMPAPVVAADAKPQASPIPATIGGVSTWVVGTLGGVAALLVASLACVCGATPPESSRGCPAPVRAAQKLWVEEIMMNRYQIPG